MMAEQYKQVRESMQALSQATASLASSLQATTSAVALHQQERQQKQQQQWGWWADPTQTGLMLAGAVTLGAVAGAVAVVLLRGAQAPTRS
jgi:hypothetical protein